MPNKAKKRKVSQEPVLQDYTVTSFSDLNPDGAAPTDTSLFDEIKSFELKVAETTFNKTDNINILSGPYPSDTSLDSFCKLESTGKNSKCKRFFQRRSKKESIEDSLFDSCLKNSFSNTSIEAVPKPLKKKATKNLRQSLFDSDFEAITPTKDPPFKKPLQRKSKNNQKPNLFDSILNTTDETVTNCSINLTSCPNVVSRMKKRLTRKRNNSNLFDEELNSSQSDVSITTNKLSLKPKAVVKNNSNNSKMFDDLLDGTDIESTAEIESQTKMSSPSASIDMCNNSNENHSKSFSLVYNVDSSKSECPVNATSNDSPLDPDPCHANSKSFSLNYSEATGEKSKSHINLGSVDIHFSQAQNKVIDVTESLGKCSESNAGLKDGSSMSHYDELVCGSTTQNRAGCEVSNESVLENKTEGKNVLEQNSKDTQRDDSEEIEQNSEVDTLEQENDNEEAEEDSEEDSLDQGNEDEETEQDLEEDTLEQENEDEGIEQGLEEDSLEQENDGEETSEQENEDEETLKLEEEGKDQENDETVRQETKNNNKLEHSKNNEEILEQKKENDLIMQMKTGNKEITDEIRHGMAKEINSDSLDSPDQSNILQENLCVDEEHESIVQRTHVPMIGSCNLEQRTETSTDINKSLDVSKVYESKLAESIHIRAQSLDNRTSLSCIRKISTLGVPIIPADQMSIITPDASFKDMLSSTPKVKGKRVSFFFKEEIERPSITNYPKTNEEEVEKTCFTEKGSNANLETTRRKSSLRCSKINNDSRSMSSVTSEIRSSRQRRVSFKLNKFGIDKIKQPNDVTNEEPGNLKSNPSDSCYSSVSLDSLVYAEGSESRTLESDSVYIDIHPSRGKSSSSSNTDSFSGFKSRSDTNTSGGNVNNSCKIIKSSDSVSNDNKTCRNVSHNALVNNKHQNSYLNSKKHTDGGSKTTENSECQEYLDDAGNEIISRDECETSGNVSLEHPSDMDDDGKDQTEKECFSNYEDTYAGEKSGVDKGSEVESEEEESEVEDEEEESEVEDEEEESEVEDEVEEESEVVENREEESAVVESGEEKTEVVENEEEDFELEEEPNQTSVYKDSVYNHNSSIYEDCAVDNLNLTDEQDENINPDSPTSEGFKLPLKVRKQKKTIRTSSLFLEKPLNVPSKSKLQDILHKIPFSELKRNRRKLSQNCISREQMEQYEIEEELLRNQHKKPLKTDTFSVSGKLKRPKEWVTQKLYNFLISKLQPQYGIRSRIQAEELVIFLAEQVECIKKKKELLQEDVDKMKLELARLCIVRTHWDFFQFINKYFDYGFRNKMYPSLPGSRSAFEFGPANVMENIMMET